MPELLPEQDGIIYQEMMSHPALFAHSQPKRVAIIGDQHHCILHEAIKHRAVLDIQHITQRSISNNQEDTRVTYHISSANHWMQNQNPQSFDIIIIAEEMEPRQLSQYFALLRSDGILLVQSESPFKLVALKSTLHALQSAGFKDVQPLHFPQPNFPSGWRTAFIAKKQGVLKKIREKDIFNKSFATRYYNFDAHKAALALPEFMREELTN